MRAAPIRILLADDEHLIRGALAALLALEDDLAVVAQAATGAEALGMARALRPSSAPSTVAGGTSTRSSPPRRSARGTAR